jgi:hypothetical protein
MRLETGEAKFSGESTKLIRPKSNASTLHFAS